MAKAKEHAYLGYELSSPMLYLNSGELIDIIVSDAYWKHFAPFFKTTKSIVLTKLQEIGMVRNSLAHFRPIREDDIDLIKQNTKHVLMEIEKCLVQLTSIATVVPTNTSAPWYKRIKPIGSENIEISIFHSHDEEWLRISINYRVPTFEKNKHGEEYYSYKVGNFRTDQLVNEYEALRQNCIYISESHVWGALHVDFDINSTKEISIVFSKGGLEENLEKIVDALSNMTLTVDQETELLRQDTLARGKFVETRNATSSVRSRQDGTRYWHTTLTNMNTSPDTSTEVEFWGTRANYETDFISASSQYPWMPSSISDYEFPF